MSDHNEERAIRNAQGDALRVKMDRASLGPPDATNRLITIWCEGGEHNLCRRVRGPAGTVERAGVAFVCPCACHEVEVVEVPYTPFDLSPGNEKSIRGWLAGNCDYGADDAREAGHTMIAEIDSLRAALAEQRERGVEAENARVRQLIQRVVRDTQSDAIRGAMALLEASIDPGRDLVAAVAAIRRGDA